MDCCIFFWIELYNFIKMFRLFKMAVYSPTFDLFIQIVAISVTFRIVKCIPLTGFHVFCIIAP